MAITIRQSPTIPNMANNTLVYAVTSNTSSAAQYQYVCDLTYSGSNTVLQRIKQQPNPNNVGVFDIGQIITNYLESDNNWTTSIFSTSSYTAKRFNVRFGEEYAASVSSSVVLLYTGITNITGSPAVSASDYIYYINGLVEPNDKINWNWPSGSYYTSSVAPTGGGAGFSRQYTLSNAPLSQSIQDGEYATISIINGNFNNSSTVAQDIYFYEVNVYNSAGTNIQNISEFNIKSNGGGPRTSANDEWGDAGVYNGQTQGTQLLTIGVGPANLVAAGNTLNTSWAYYDVTLRPQESAGTEDNTAYYAKIRFIKQGAQCGYDGVRFAWKNEFGVWDYYTFTLATDKSYNIERQNYQQTFVPYNTNYPVPYSTERRGQTNFYNKLTQTQVATSNWLTQNEADWLQELFFSANVFQQLDGDFYPIVITSANLTEKTNPRSQKLFQYQIEFQVANQKNPRL
jgi:hypothetical protein